MSMSPPAPCYPDAPAERSAGARALADWVWLLLQAGRMLHRAMSGSGPQGAETARGMHPVVAPLVLERLGQLARGFARLIGLIDAGVGPLPPSPRPGRTTRGGPRGPRVWPVRLDETGLPGAGVFRVAVQGMLAELEIAHLVATDPRAERLLRRACAVFGVRMDGYLAPRPPSAEFVEPEPEPWPVPASLPGSVAPDWVPGVTVSKSG